jgi:DNA-binding transcriptional MerR regulator
MLNIGEFARLGQVSPRMLRHYDEIGLFRPEQVDPVNGYRLYSLHQLGQLHRLVALRELGFTLQQISDVLDEDPPLEHLRGRLKMRRAQIEQEIAEQQSRIRRVEAHLRALEGNLTVNVSEIVVKQTQPIRIAEATGTAVGYGPENIGPIFDRLLPNVWSHLHNAGARPGISVAYYDWPAEDGTIVVHLGFDVGDQQVPDGDAISVVDLPVVTVASVVHRGPMDGIVPVFETLVQWIDDSGYRLAGRSRELYHEWHADAPQRHVTELQLPIEPLDVEPPRTR